MYTLGSDAIVVTIPGMLSQFQAVTILGNGSSLVDNRKSPDLVDSLERSWSCLEPSVVRDQKAEIDRIVSLLSTGRARWWKCRKCGREQPYQRSNADDSWGRFSRLPAEKGKASEARASNLRYKCPECECEFGADDDPCGFQGACPVCGIWIELDHTAGHCSSRLTSEEGQASQQRVESQKEEIPLLPKGDTGMAEDEAISQYVETLKSETYVQRLIAIDKLVAMGERVRPFLEEAARSDIPHQAAAAEEALERLAAVESTPPSKGRTPAQYDRRDEGSSPSRAQHAGKKTTRFCTRRNEPIELEEVGGSLTCIPYGIEVSCTESRCKYSTAAVLHVRLFGSLFGSSASGFPDYTTESENLPG